MYLFRLSLEFMDLLRYFLVSYFPKWTSLGTFHDTLAYALKTTQFSIFIGNVTTIFITLAMSELTGHLLRPLNTLFAVFTALATLYFQNRDLGRGHEKLDMSSIEKQILEDKESKE